MALWTVARGFGMIRRASPTVLTESPAAEVQPSEREAVPAGSAARWRPHGASYHCSAVMDGTDSSGGERIIGVGSCLRKEVTDEDDHQTGT